MSNIFEGIDDYMFPVTPMGKRAAGLFEEAPQNSVYVNACEQFIGESAGASARALAMQAVLEWQRGDDFSYDAMDGIIIVLADLDGDEDISEEEEAYYNEVWEEIPNALLSLGAKIDDVEEFVDGPGSPADKAGDRIGDAISDELDETPADDDDLVASFAYGEDGVLECAGDDYNLRGVLEATYKKRKMVRNGKVIVARKRVSGRIKLSAAQRAGLKKARRKANTAAAKQHRRKSMKIRKLRGM